MLTLCCYVNDPTEHAITFDTDPFRNRIPLSDIGQGSVGPGNTVEPVGEGRQREALDCACLLAWNMCAAAAAFPQQHLSPLRWAVNMPLRQRLHGSGGAHPHHVWPLGVHMQSAHLHDYNALLAPCKISRMQRRTPACHHWHGSSASLCISPPSSLLAPFLCFLCLRWGILCFHDNCSGGGGSGFDTLCCLCWGCGSCRVGG